MTTHLSPDLIEAYEATVYCVFADSGELHLKVGKHSDEADDFLNDAKVTSAAFLTAWNPRSEVLAPAVNAQRHQALIKDAEEQGFTWLHGEGRDPKGEWAAEQSLLILGLQPEQAEELARRYKQNAYVMLFAGRPVELVLTGLMGSE